MSDVKSNVAKQYKTLETLQIQYVSPADVKPNSYNPNRQSERDFELLKKMVLLNQLLFKNLLEKL